MLEKPLILSGSRYQRFIDFVNPDTLSNMNLCIIGAGGIGSFTALYLAKMGCHNITLWDPDKFEEQNLSTQLCRIQDLGKSKVQAVADIIAEFEGVEISTVESMFDGSIAPGTIVISAVDSMKSRKEIWEMVKDQPISMLIDGRMGLTIMSIYTVLRDITSSIDMYEASLWEDEEVTPLPCTARATIFTGGTIASLICNLITKVAREDEVPQEITFDMRDLYMRAIKQDGTVATVGNIVNPLSFTEIDKKE